jgi:SAM-dependent methyltransferase
MGKNKTNHLLRAVIEKFKNLPKGRVLDLGCGDGDYAALLKQQGFDVVAADIDKKRFRHDGAVPFEICDITRVLPFADNSFDYVLLMEVVEHLRDPYDCLPRIHRVIKKGGSLVLSTPNILNMKSRFRFLFEGAYDYFREAPLDQVKNPKEKIFNLHLFPYRYQELEYLLSASGFDIADIFTSVYEGHGMAVLGPLMRWRAWSKERRSRAKGGISYARIHRILLSKELLFGRHVIVRAQKQ